MGAVKAMAIELEIRRDEAVALGNADLAYRLGMLEACRLISETGSRFIETSSVDPFVATSQCWREVYDAASYLREVSDRN